ncbi:uncharacterized protein LOC125679457 isoform X1 [Ostrea edulis]|uniref:uncharacterized protein LOC125679457 isoform X1 n=1 Tax=Ostrea edulis TaxID=37623 RepID=UPI0024AFB73D|nr:uncharacterized protein LOC125679457 isoform X1 [Ostrea edulis]
MVDAICVIMVFHVLISEVALTNSPGNGTCGTSVDGFKCCTDYIRNGSRCVPCIGSFGLGCNTTCHPGYYGFGCKKKCECEQCDKLNGSCIANNTTQMQSNGKVSSGSWLPVIFGVLISSGSMAGVLAILYIRRRSDVRFTMEPQKIEDVNEDELPYDVVRESRMIMDEIVGLPRSSNDTSSEASDIYSRSTKASVFVYKTP